MEQETKPNWTYLMISPVYRDVAMAGWYHSNVIYVSK